MKSRFLMLFTALALLIALAVPLWLAAQQQSSQQQKREHARYKLIDMGTFGGPNSFVTEQIFGFPLLNHLGVTIGGSATFIPTSPTSNFLVCAVPYVSHGFRWQNGAVTDLGALPGGDNCSAPFSVNSNGEIVGNSENGVVDPLIGVNETRTVLWKDGQIQNLGSFGGNQNGANGINDRGQIVGFSLNTIPDPYSLYDSFLVGAPNNGTQTRAFLWQHGQMQDLGTLGDGAGPDAAALFINERGQVAGFSYTSSVPNPLTGVPPTDPFLWKEGRMTDLGTLGGVSGSPTALNNSGLVIGKSSIATDPGACGVDGNPNCHAFLWDNGRLIDLFPETGVNSSFAAAINDAGEIVGETAFPNAPFDAYIWRNGVATDLGTLNGDCFSTAQAVNSHSQVVGNALSCDGNFDRAFLWENGSIVDLNALIPAGSSLQLVSTSAINDRGEIAGVGSPPGCSDHNVCGHAFLLIPCDEKHSDSEGCEEHTESGGALSQAHQGVRESFGQGSSTPLLRRMHRYPFLNRESRQEN